MVNWSRLGKAMKVPFRWVYLAISSIYPNLTWENLRRVMLVPFREMYRLLQSLPNNILNAIKVLLLLCWFVGPAILAALLLTFPIGVLGVVWFYYWLAVVLEYWKAQEKEKGKGGE